MRIVVNSCGCGLDLSSKALDKLIERGWRVEQEKYNDYGFLIKSQAELITDSEGNTRLNPLTEIHLRTHKDLIEVVQELGEEANYYYFEFSNQLICSPEVIEIPNNMEWQIEYDEHERCEYISEKHKQWRPSKKRDTDHD